MSQISEETARLAVLCAVIKQGRKDKSDISNAYSKNRIKSDMRGMHDRFPHLKIDQYEMVKSDQNQCAFKNDRTKELIIVYTQTSLSWTILQLNDIIYQCGLMFLGLQSPRATSEEAMQFIEQARKSYPDYKVKLTGHSLGGTMAENVSILTGFDCETFNRGIGLPLNLNSRHFQDLRQVNQYKGDRLPIIISNISSNDKGAMSKFGSVGVGEVRIMPETCTHGIDSILQTHQIQRNQNQSNFGQNDLVGVDFSNIQNISQFSNEKGGLIKGFHFNKERNISNFVVENQKQLQINGIEMDDLVVALLVFYSDDVKHKQISFSLDAQDERNPWGQFMKKVYYPDTLEGKKIVEGTKFGEIMFEADWVMKQLSLGIKVSSLHPFKSHEMIYPSKLKKLGLAPSHQFNDQYESFHNNPKKEDWCRLWIVVQGLTQKRLQDESNNADKYIELDDFVMGVEARQMEVDRNGRLADRKVQNTNHRSYKFAQKFTQCYDQIAEEFPIFHRLKKVAKAISLAQWMWINNVPIDLTKIVEQVNQQRFDNHPQNMVPSLYREFMNWDLISIRKTSVFGGVDIQIQFSLLMDSKRQQSQTFNEVSQKMDCKVNYVKHLPKLEDQITNPFLPAIKCLAQKCEVQLEQNQMSSYLCRYHDPMVCQVCFDYFEVGQEYVQCRELNYHKNCFNCIICLHPIQADFVCYMDMIYIHPECCKQLESMETELEPKTMQQSKIQLDQDEIIQRAFYIQDLLEIYPYERCYLALMKFDGDENEAINELISGQHNKNQMENNSSQQQEQQVTEQNLNQEDKLDNEIGQQSYKGNKIQKEIFKILRNQFYLDEGMIIQQAIQLSEVIGDHSFDKCFYALMKFKGDMDEALHELMSEQENDANQLEQFQLENILIDNQEIEIKSKIDNSYFEQSKQFINDSIIKVNQIRQYMSSQQTRKNFIKQLDEKYQEEIGIELQRLYPRSYDQ